MSHDNRGKYIVIDGIDGGGKTTLFESLRKVFTSWEYINTENNKSSTDSGPRVVYTMEPGGTTLGEKLRTIILSDYMDPFSEMCLFMAQRKEARNMLEPYLDNGTHAISDRSESATFAYQIRGRELHHLESLFWEMNNGLEPFPTMYIFLDLKPSLAFERLNSRGENVARDVFEKEQVEYFERVRNGFLEFPSKVTTPCFFVNANQSKEKVVDEVVALIKKHISTQSQTLATS